MDNQTQTDLEAAVLRRLLAHLDSRTDVANIDLMNLAGFCRNCLAKWMVTEAEERDLPMDYEGARERIYGMPYAQWKEAYQRPATEEELARFESR